MFATFEVVFLTLVAFQLDFFILQLFYNSFFFLVHENHEKQAEIKYSGLTALAFF